MWKYKIKLIVIVLFQYIGKSLSVELDPKWDIKDVKELVAPQLGFLPDEVKIIFAGKELHDSTFLSVR